ncbi:MAG TPA: APC family permease [Gaiellaceae bacterium]|nr:APC family permease [Gaiellaceae bacterium]
MEAAPAGGGRFEHLREHSIGLPQVLFQSITHMAPAAAVAYSIFISVPDAHQALPLSVGLALIACLCAATAIGQLAKRFPSAGGMYTYTARTLGPSAGFLVAWLFILFEPLVAPFLYLEFGWAMSDVFSNSLGWHYSGQWWIWVCLMTVIVFLLTYRDVRLSTTAGVILGAFEIGIFAALAIWMLLSNAGDLNLQPFNPNHAAGEWSGVFKGMVFAILAFIGFEASAPLGEEARHPRRTVPRAVVGSALAIGLFYVLCSYAWVFGAGFSSFVDQATTNPDPWRSLGKTFWAGGWVLIFLAICNSIAANSNAAVNAGTRVFYALARNRLAPAPLGRTHPRFKTPHVAIFWMSLFALVLSLLFGWKWGPLTGFALIATLAVPVVIVVYMLVSAGCIWFYWTKRRDEFNPLLHLVLPVVGIVLFFFPLYYQFYEAPPAYPVKYANWVAIAWTVLGLALTAWVSSRHRDRLADMERVYVEDETIAPEDGAAPTLA